MKHITALQLKQLLKIGKEVLLVDVREPYEHRAFNIGGNLMPMGTLLTEAPNLPRNIPVVLYCKRGLRSQIAIQRLEAKFGLSNLYNLSGGLDKWTQ